MIANYLPVFCNSCLSCTVLSSISAFVLTVSVGLVLHVLWVWPFIDKDNLFIGESSVLGFYGS